MRQRLTIKRVAIGAAAGLLLLVTSAQAQIKLRDLVSIEGVRSNQLVGYGLVVGLQLTGDTLRNSQFTQQSLSAMLERMGVNVNGLQLQTRNTAAVVVTATLPAFARQGSPLDVQVSSLGDAKSLIGGTLMVTPLMGADGEVYAVAQGPVVVGGIVIAGAGQVIKQGVQTAGRVPGGATVEREIANTLDDLGSVRLALRSPDFTTATRMEQAINARFGEGTAVASDLGTVDLHVPPAFTHRVTELLAQVELIEVRPENSRPRGDRREERHDRGRRRGQGGSGGNHPRQPHGPGDRDASGQSAWAVFQRSDGRGPQHRDRREYARGSRAPHAVAQCHAARTGGWAERIGPRPA